MSALDDYLSANRERYEEELCELLRIESISADSQYRDQVKQAAVWVAGQFESMKFKTELIETDGNPLVYAESPPVPGRPVVLVYGHYDVQPPDPLDEWITPPFEPTRRDGNIVARGATDDKGQMFTHIKSAEAWIAENGKLPLQVKYLIEGEEETGSHNLYKYLDGGFDGNALEKLACDVVVISDTSQYAPGQPAITYGLKGIAYFELLLQGPKQDLHSGVFGGAVSNPANAITQMLASLVDENGRIQVPHFYDDVVCLTDSERNQFAGLGFEERVFMEQLGVDALHGESGYSTLERRWARPTFDINGLWSGYQGEGEKTVLPGRAGAKFSFRLVPNQKPEDIARHLETILREVCPPGIEMNLKVMHGTPGVVVPLESRFMNAAAEAIELGFGRWPVFIREGGSIPVVNAFHDKLGVDTLLLGWGLNDDNTHGPNEKFCLADFHRGIKASANLWQTISKVPPADA